MWGGVLGGARYDRGSQYEGGAWGGPYLVALGGGDGFQVLAGDAHHLLAVLQVDRAHPTLREENRGGVGVTLSPSTPKTVPQTLAGCLTVTLRMTPVCPTA